MRRRVTKKLLDFQASISDVKQVNPLFSTCKVRVLYTGKNRNMSIITKDAVEKALPTLKNIPIVGEYSEENKDYKGHGGAIDLIHINISTLQNHMVLFQNRLLTNGKKSKEEMVQFVNI